MGKAPRSCSDSPWHYLGPCWGCYRIPENPASSTFLPPNHCSGPSASQEYFLQESILLGQAQGTEGQEAPLPAQPRPHCYFFQLKKKNISSSSSWLCGGWTGQDGEAPAQAVLKAQVCGLQTSGPVWPVTAGSLAPPGPPCPHPERYWIISTLPIVQCVVPYGLQLTPYLSFTHILKTAINAFIKQALHHYCITCQTQKIRGHK